MRDDAQHNQTAANDRSKSSVFANSDCSMAADGVVLFFAKAS
jgi:hypothetical protein